MSLIRDGDRLVAYRLHKGTEGAPLVMFTHQQIDEYVLTLLIICAFIFFPLKFIKHLIVILRTCHTCTAMFHKLDKKALRPWWQGLVVGVLYDFNCLKELTKCFLQKIYVVTSNVV